MGRHAPVPLPFDLATWPLPTVTVRQLADHTGIPGRTLRHRCIRDMIPGARRRSDRPESEWLIPKEEALRIEVECGLRVKHSIAS